MFYSWKFNLISAFLICFCFKGQAQIFYGLTDGFAGGDSLVVIDLSTCTSCTPASICTDLATEMEVLPNGNYLIAMGVLEVCNPAGGTPQFFPAPAYVVAGAGGGLYYYSGPTVGLGLYNFNTGTVQTLGALPPGLSFGSGGDLFYVNGILYGMVLNANNLMWELYQINTSNPTLSVFLATLPYFVVQGVTTIGNTIYVLETPSSGTGSVISTYNLATNTATPVCTFDVFLYSLSAIPAGVTPLSCSCTTNAGTVTAGINTFCLPAAAQVPYNGNAVLDGDDLLQYILFTNPANPLSSILVQSNSSTFAFNSATMQLGVIYYAATIAGNNVGGNVALNDPCFDISNTTQIIWRPNPTVTFTAANPNVCAGACTTVTATFTGTAPFTLTYTSAGGSAVTQTFPGNSGTFQVCVPVGAAPGSFSVVATSLADANCSCL